QVANINGYSSFICNLSAEPDRAYYLQLLHEKRVDGIIIATSHITDDQLVRVLREEVSLVLINREMNGIPSVCTDSELGGWMATCHLVDTGHRVIGYIGVPPSVKSGIQRKKGYERALRERRLPLVPGLIMEEENSADGGHRAATALLASSRRGSAVFVYDDVMAIGAIRAIQEAGLSVPGDMAVVGYDDIAIAAHVTPPLTTVRQAKELMGIKAMQLLLALMAGENAADNHVMLRPELIVRESSSARV
ncbi:MAG TPA: substrate-binding domain-containing protein, partial [Anaerolineae bacterium]|nr:substrate-binding domain-containing protein [Anaerolineae bacterium]